MLLCIAGAASQGRSTEPAVGAAAGGGHAVGPAGYQLTADLPGWSPGAKAGVPPLTLLVNILNGGLHCVPLETAYTGPQVALHVWPTPHGFGAWQQKQPSRQTASAQSPVNCVVTPTAAVLAEMLPLFIRFCLTGLEALEAGRQQQQQQPTSATKATHAPGAASSTSNAAAQAAGNTSPNSQAPMAVETWSVCACLNRIAALLFSVGLPVRAAADTLRPAGAAAACSDPLVAPAGHGASYSCVLPQAW